MIELRPIKQKEAFAHVKAHHRHHQPPPGGLWWQAVQNDDGVLVGVAVSGRPVSKALDDGLTVEVTRMCTDGTPNACSMLYGAARRVAEAKGFRRGLTYILSSENGASLRAAGYRELWKTRGGSWDRDGRPRTDKHPTEPKTAYGWGAWPELAEDIAA